MPSADKRILDRIVKNVMTDEEDPFTALIDEYFVKRNLPKYRDRRLKEVTLDLEERPRPPGRLSPSSLCGCERQAVFKFVGAPGVRRNDPDAEMVFEDGHWRHFKWHTLFKDMERVLGRHRIRIISQEEDVAIPKLFIAGSLDLVVKIKIRNKWVAYVVDYKGANSFAWQRAHREQKPDETYVRQLIAYMRARKIKRGVLLYDSKDKSHVHCFVVSFTPKLWAEVQNWAEDVIEAMENQKLPQRHPDCDRGNFLYGRCPWRNLCFGNLSPLQIRRKIYKNFPGVQEAWVAGNEEAGVA